jgi:hypothetical protein
VKKIIAVSLLVLAVSGVALGDAGFWTKPKSNSSRAYFATGTGTVPTDLQPDGGIMPGFAPDGGVKPLATQPSFAGLGLSTMHGFVVTVEVIADAGSMTAGTLRCYIFDATNEHWARNPDMDLTVSEGRTQTFWGFQAVSPTGRVAYVPNGLGQPVNITITGTP